MGESNNNPSTRQFSAAFKKVLIHNDIEEVARGNCLPLESVPILTASSKYTMDINISTHSSKIINSSLAKSRVLENDALERREKGFRPTIRNLKWI